MKDTEQFRKGDKVRREVLGDEFVNKSFANADDFNREMFELSTD
jgi:4-carboxymuconolactone decarboxylase